VSRRLGSTSPKPGEARQDRLSLNEVNVADLLAVPTVPAQGRTLELGGLRATLSVGRVASFRITEALRFG
jgi:hypothetical protein